MGGPMIAWIAGTAAAALLALHEWIARRHRRWVWMRRSALMAGLGAAMVWALAARPHEHLQAWLRNATRGDVPAFEAIGDAALVNAPTHVTPTLRFPERADADAVRAWQADLRSRLNGILRLPAGEPSDAFTNLSEQKIGDVTRRFGYFVARDGTRIPCFICVPPGAARAPAVLVVPGHGRGIVGTAGVIDDYQHAAALRIAAAGFVTLTPEVRGFGYLGDEKAFAHRIAAANALNAGFCYKAFVAADMLQAIRILRAQPEVDPKRVGVAGTSFGGELSVLLGSLDPTLRAICSHGYGGLTGRRAGVPATVAAEVWALPHGCHLVPGFNRIGVPEDWFRLLAPRPVQVRRGDTEATRLDALREAVLPVYALLGGAVRADIALAEGGHEFFVEAAIRFLTANL